MLDTASFVILLLELFVVYLLKLFIRKLFVSLFIFLAWLFIFVEALFSHVTQNFVFIVQVFNFGPVNVGLRRCDCLADFKSTLRNRILLR